MQDQARFGGACDDFVGVALRRWEPWAAHQNAANARESVRQSRFRSSATSILHSRALGQSARPVWRVRQAACLIRFPQPFMVHHRDRRDREVS